MVDYKIIKKICILGSGVSGSILASELSNKYRVTVIDCDTLNKSFDDSVNLAKFTDAKLRNEKVVGYGFGGTTNLWHGVLTSLDYEDMQVIDKVSQTCISSEFEGFSDKLEKYFGNLNFLKSNELRSNKLLRFISLSSLNFKRYVHMVRPARFRKIVKHLKNRGKVETIECAVAISLSLDKTLKAIESVKVLQNNKEIHISADVFIVAMGALESPRILLQSFEDSKHNNPIIGSGLMDHPHATIGSLTIPDYIFYTQHGTRSMLFSNSSRVGYTIPGKYRKIKKLNHSIYVLPSMLKDVDKVRANIKLLVNNKFSFKLILKILSRPSLLLSAFILISERFGFGVYTNLFNIHIHLEQSIEGRSSVSLSNNTDQYGRRIPKIYRNFANDAIKDISNIQVLLKKLTIPPGVFKSISIENNKLDSGAHFSGTCRLGSRRNNSVVDKNLKYHSLKNLFICDASIIPKTGNSNLSLTIACFALRLSNYLNERYDRKN